MNIRSRLLKVANNLMEDVVKSFEMTEEEWKKYNELHPNAKRENHQIIPDRKNQNGNGRKIQMTDEQKKLHKKAMNGDVYEKEEVARNEKTHPYTLHLLSNDEDYDVKSSVSSNPNTPTQTILNLIDSLNKDDREYLAFNTSTPKEVLDKLSEDEDYDIREYVAENENTSQKILEKLSEDEYYGVRECVAKNKNTSQKILEKLAKDEDWHVREVVFEESNLSTEVLDKLSEDEDYDIREYVAENPNTPSETIEKMIKKETDADLISILINHPNSNESIFSDFLYRFINEIGLSHKNEEIADIVVTYACEHGGCERWFNDYYHNGKLRRYDWIHDWTVQVDNNEDPIWRALAEQEGYLDN